MNDLSSMTLPEDANEAKSVFQNLPFQQQLDLVLRSRGKERLQTLFLSEHPETLVQALPEQEVFLTIKEVGERDCLELIALTTPEQFQYLLDLECWKRDQIDPEKALHWVEILLESGERKVAQFIQTAEPEWIALLLKKFLRVTTLDGEPVEMMDRLPLFTLDQFYFIDFKGVRAREVFEPFLRAFYRMEPEGYRRLMEALLCELESELEETGYRLRKGRLNDYGFPDFEEALEIYQFLPPDSLLRKVGAPVSKPLEPLNKESSLYYLTFKEEGPFFSNVLSHIDGFDELDRLKQEITTLCNKAIVAEAIDLSNLAGMERAVKKVYHYLNLGLQYLSQGEVRKGVEVLRSLPIQTLFQCGISLTILSKRRAESILKGSWFQSDREALGVLDPPHFEMMEGILRKRPTFFRNGVHDDFKDLQDLKTMDSFLEWMEGVLSFLEKTLKVTASSLKEREWNGCIPEKWQELTLSTVLLTSLANHLLKGTFQFEAIEKAQIKDLLAHLLEQDAEGRRVVKPGVRKECIQLLHSIETDPQRRLLITDFLHFSLELFEEEFGKIPATTEIDPRFVKGLLIRL